MQQYICKTCGEVHQGIPTVYGADAPHLWYSLSEEERDSRALLSSDQCIIDDEYFFILGRLEIPILHSEEVFCWLVWVSLSINNFARASELWEQEGREQEPGYFGWLSTSLPVYPETLSLKATVHTRPVGERPFVELEPTEHPLSVEQSDGITWERVQDIAEKLLHEQSENRTDNLIVEMELNEFDTDTDSI
jgi:hypothetical protein